ncbi:hypothetical protein CgunFtcFv8_001270 [Champsocephalus gunnari]|uniref:Uncharacterized protein n=1 Tax=Champsocephalus gunnari TaxID=52237 RepID=A0AAN8DMC5_CHAGU|nr:hypothetical protein CgunFtcFv8_001270 [Champsocephalus gunnari]
MPNTNPSSTHRRAFDTVQSQMCCSITRSIRHMNAPSWSSTLRRACTVGPAPSVNIFCDCTLPAQQSPRIQWSPDRSILASLSRIIIS